MLIKTKNGTLPYQEIIELAKCGAIYIPDEPNYIKKFEENKQFQPSTFDITLSDTAYRIRSSFIPRKNETVYNLLEDLQIPAGKFSLEKGAFFEVGKTYIIPINERLKLPEGFSVHANPKSSIGRLDVATTIICDNNPQFNIIPDGYKGQLYLILQPLSFMLTAQPGVSVSQLRFYYNNQNILDDAELKIEFAKQPLLYNVNEPIKQENIEINKGLLTHIDLKKDIVSYRARKDERLGPIDLSLKNTYDIDEYWETINKPKDDWLILNPNDFYLFSTKEITYVPSHLAFEIMATREIHGNIQVHSAGFADPGFKASLTLEMRCRDSPIRMVDGQPIATLQYERLRKEPEIKYGNQQLGSSYQAQEAPRVSKHFCFK